MWAQKIGKTCSHEGVQDATRKRHEQSQCPGAWAGVVCGTMPHGVFLGVTQEKWDKTKSELAQLRADMDKVLELAGQQTVCHKMLEQVAGYLNQIARAYPSLKVYLNGIYATMNVWRPDRDEEGWKIGDIRVDYDTNTPPKQVKVIDCLKFDLHALETPTQAEVPPERLARPNKFARPRYFFGDASGAGYGVSGWSPGDNSIEIDFGAWDPQKMSSSSSNERELLNLVLKIEQLHTEGKVNPGTEFFLFTDNWSAEAAFYRGSAKSKSMLMLMLRLHQICMNGQSFIHIIWVSGKRMIAQGTDGLSRSDYSTGVMRGQPMLEHVPLNLSAFDRQPQRILSFLHDITGSEKFTQIEPKDWYSVPFDTDGSFLWFPPPCVADVAVFQMAESFHVQPWNLHVMMVPQLMTGFWRKMIVTATDFFVVLPFDKLLWPLPSEHEPLTLAVCFPTLNRNLWRVKCSDILLRRAHELQSLRKWGFPHTRNYLRELWVQARALQSMPTGLARSLLQG